MAKTKTTYFCQNCGAQATKWIGKCPACNEWNTYVEEVVEKSSKSDKTDWRDSSNTHKASKPIRLSEVQASQTERYITSDQELNRVLGGGIVAGSLVLIGGEPGIGKSTLLLQVALSLQDAKVLYVSGEESEQQIKMRADRLGLKNYHCYILSETSTKKIFQQIKNLEPHVLVVDSIQTLQSEYVESTPGSISQIRECTGQLQQFAKETNTPVFIIGHINKDGHIAGPKVLEHIVDTVLQFEGDQHYSYRILRTIKNRFGSASELGIYEMQSKGLRQVSNPSEILLSQKEEQLSGIAVAATLEGARPILIETQALVTPAVYGTPQRSSTGFDLRRLNMLLAVLEKRGGFKFGVKDVFLNIAGGIKVDDPAIDLAVVCALLSSYEDTNISSQYCFSAEVGLSGEVRAINRIEQRISEASKLGFDKIFISKYNLKGLDRSKFEIEIVALSKVEELYQRLF